MCKAAKVCWRKNHQRSLKIELKRHSQTVTSRFAHSGRQSNAARLRPPNVCNDGKAMMKWQVSELLNLLIVNLTVLENSARRRYFGGRQRGMARKSWNISGRRWRSHFRRQQQWMEHNGFRNEEQKEGIWIQRSQGLFRGLRPINKLKD